MSERSDWNEITQLIHRAATDDHQAKELLYREVYEELRRLARRVIRTRDRVDLESGVLVNEVVIRFEKAQCFPSFANRKVFFSVAVRAMNQVLIDHYRRRKRQIDGDDRSREPLDGILRALEKECGADFLDLHLAIERLEAESPRQHAVIMHRFFAGLSAPQTADFLGVSLGTVERDWRLARAKLYRTLKANHET